MAHACHRPWPCFERRPFGCFPFSLLIIEQKKKKGSCSELELMGSWSKQMGKELLVFAVDFVYMWQFHLPGMYNQDL